MLAVGGATNLVTTILPRTSDVVSRASSMKSVVPVTSAVEFDVGEIADHSASGFPLNETELEPVEIRVRRIFHHWNQLPPSPRGVRPIFRISSASQIDARIS